MRTKTLIALLIAAAAPALASAETATDRQIENAAKSSYNFRVVLDEKVTADSENGVVTLSGSVLERDQKALAEDTVRSLPGVLSVIDNIHVEPEPAVQSDAWIAHATRPRR